MASLFFVKRTTQRLLYQRHYSLRYDSPFFALENCTVLPHMAGISQQARLRQGQMMLDETLRFLAGEPLRFQVTRARWDTMA
jgi:phosphoglycerate dehydrogenase-like enzyme